MTLEERVSLFKDRISKDELDVLGDNIDLHIKTLLLAAQNIIFEVRFPYSAYPDDVEAKYHGLQVSMAIELFVKEGAEGEIMHSENGLSRTYTGTDVSISLLERITPMCG